MGLLATPACINFAADGTYLFSWGEPGTAPGQFNLPHGVWMTRTDASGSGPRENDRVQIFDQDGKFLQVWFHHADWPGLFLRDADDIVYIPEHNGGLVSVLTLEASAWRSGVIPASARAMASGVTSRGDLYVVRPGVWGRPRRVVKYVRLH